MTVLRWLVAAPIVFAMALGFLICSRHDHDR